MLNKVQRRFLQKIAKGVAGIALVVVVQLGLTFLFGIWFDKEQASDFAFLSLMGGTVLFIGLGLAWDKAKYEVEEENRVLFKALRGDDV